MKNGMINSEQLQAALLYAEENHRDLRQAILELNLIAPDTLNALAFEHLAAMAQGNGAPVAPAPAPTPGPAVETPITALHVSPDSTKYQRDIRNELRELADTATLPDLVAQVFERAIDCRSTDIHFDPQDNGLRVRFRIDGQLQDIVTLDPGVTTAVISRIKVMSNLNIVERRHSQDGRITITHMNRPRDLRVATFPTAMGEKIVIRIHESLSEAQTFDHLGMTQAQAEKLLKLISRPYGAVLVAGPVGAGKTSTLYSCLGKINQPTRNVMTIEDPIEYRIPGVNQTQVDPRGELRFSDGLKAMLRQDPDVIMIGEIRDDETARIGIRAALTGVLVFSSIHASDCTGTIGNLYNFGIPGYQLSSSLLGIVSQRLIRKICPYCRVNYPADAKILAALEVDPAQYDGLTLHRGVGCPACFQTGYLGRTGVFEIMEVNDELRELVFQQIPKDILRRVAVDLGMQTLKSSAVDKVLEGTTTVEEIYRVVSI
jgi:type II secretory ATPase GspE/PulE/Tfp pilus assembly ATPase PilB-like protein